MAVQGRGLGKERTRLGRYLNSCGLTQGWLEKKTGLGEATIGRICSDKSYAPTERTKMKIVSVLQREVDAHVSVGDFW